MEEFMPGTMSVADFERRRDAATTHCLKGLEQQLKDHKKRQVLRKVKWYLAFCGIVAFLVAISFLCPVFPKARTPLHPLNGTTSPLLQQGAAVEGFVSRPAISLDLLERHSNALQVVSTELSEQHSQALDIGSTDSVPSSLLQPETPDLPQISDSGVAQLARPDETELPHHATLDVGVVESQHGSDACDNASVSDQSQPKAQQQQLVDTFIYEQSQVEQPDSRQSQSEQPQPAEVNRVNVSSSLTLAGKPATHDIEPQQLKLIISMLKQGQLVLPDQTFTANLSSSFVVKPIGTASSDQLSVANLSTRFMVKAVLIRLGTQTAAYLNSSVGAVQPYYTSPGLFWRQLGQYVDTLGLPSWAMYTLAGVAVLLAFGMVRLLCNIFHRRKHCQAGTVAKPNTEVLSRQTVQLIADSRSGGVTATGRLHVPGSTNSGSPSPVTADSSAPGTPDAHSASPALNALHKTAGQLRSEPSSPTLAPSEDCRTPFAQVKATGMMNTPVTASAQPVPTVQHGVAVPAKGFAPVPAPPPTLQGSATPARGPAPPPPPPSMGAQRASSVPVPPPPPPPMPGSGLKKTPTPPPPPPPPGSGIGIKGRPTPPPPPPGGSAKSHGGQAGDAQAPDAALLAAAVATPEAPSRAKQHWQKLKKLHWDQVQGTRKGVWLVVNSQAAQINFDRLATRFKVVARTSKPAATPKSPEVALLDRTRAMNLAIPLTKLNMKPADIKTALVTLDGRGLTMENLEALLKMVPTDDEAKSVHLFLQGKHHNHIGICDVNKLDASGQYCAEVVGIPNLAERISSFVFVRQFGDNLQRVTCQLEMVNKACQELRSSKQLNDLLAHVLAVGNFLNESSGSVTAIGFKLATLLKLTFLRDDSGKSLLHFVLDEMTEAGSISDRLMHQLASTPAAADIQMGGLKGVIADQAIGLQLVNKVLLQPALAAAASCEEDEQLLQDLQSFYQKAEAMLSATQAQFEAVSRGLEDLSLFFMEVHDVTRPEQLLKTIKDFMTLFRKTLVEVQAAREQAKAKQLREQRLAAGQPHRSASLPASRLNAGHKAQARASRLLHRGSSHADAPAHSKPQ